MQKIAIVEDDEKCTKRLCEVLDRCSNELGVKCQVQCFKSGMDFITDYYPVYDLILLDISMPLLDGIETSKKLREIDPEVSIIFVTNLAQYAIKSYEVGALDYIVKPVEYKTFFIKFKRFLKISKERRDRYILLNTEGNVRKINVKDILYIEIIGHFLHYHLREQTVVCYGSIAQAEKEMEHLGFCRIYKSYIVNLDCIREIKLNTVILDDGTELMLSRLKKKEFMQKAAEYFGNGYLMGGGVNFELFDFCVPALSRLRNGRFPAETAQSLLGQAVCLHRLLFCICLYRVEIPFGAGNRLA